MKLSIVIPTYNRYESTLKLVESLKHVDFNQVEIIVVNDCSTQVYGEFPSYIKYQVNQMNSGAVVTRMNGYKASVGKYIWFFDSDDSIHEDAVKNILNAISTDESDVHVFGMLKEFKNKKIKLMPFKVKDKKPETLGYCSYFQDKIFKREVIEESMFDLDCGIFQDENFILRFGAKAKSVRVHNDMPPISTYWYNFGSISKSANDFKRVSRLIKTVESLVPFIKTLPDNEFKYYAKRQMTRMLAIAAGWSLGLKKKECKIIIRQCKKIKLNDRKCFGFIANYSVAHFLTKLISIFK